MPDDEIARLSAVYCEGLYLRLQDGRMLMINPDDAPGIQKWKPDMELTIRESGAAALFNLKVTRPDMTRNVRGAWV